MPATCCIQRSWDMLRSNVAVVWPELVNAAGPTMLRNVAFKCCDHLAGACKCCWVNNVGMLCWNIANIKVNWHLLKQGIHWGHFFKKLMLTKCWFSTGLHVYVRLTCCKLDRIVRKPVNANPGLKVNKSINISCTQKFSTVFVLCILRLFKLKTESQIVYKKQNKTQIKILS